LVSRRLAIGVDDFGQHEGINRATIGLADLGRLNAVSCLVGGPAWASGRMLLRGLDRERTDIGLHLDLTQFPLGRNAPMRLPALIARAYLGALPRVPLRAEIAAQLDAFEAALGRAPDFVDGHQHVHQLPRVREMLLDVMHARGGVGRAWLRNTCGPESVARAHGKPRLIETLGAHALSRLARARGHAQNRHLLGVWSFDGDAAAYRQHLAAWVREAVDGDLLMCHPSLPCSEPSDAILAARCAEWAVLSSDEFAALLAREGIVPTPIGRCVALA
jgi:chitin disaccharide deacetylase